MREKVTIKPQKTKVGISFRDLGNDTMNAVIMESAACFISFFSSRGFQIEIFTQVERDHNFNLKIYETFKAKYVINFNQHPLEWNDIGFYSDMFAVLSNRLHVLLLGQVHQAIPLGILDENKSTSKIKGIYAAIGAEHLIFNKLLNQEISLIYNDREKIIAELIEINEIQHELIKEKIKGIFNGTN
jgi:hypothetical protein